MLNQYVGNENEWGDIDFYPGSKHSVTLNGDGVRARTLERSPLVIMTCPAGVWLISTCIFWITKCARDIEFLLIGTKEEGLLLKSPASWKPVCVRSICKSEWTFHKPCQPWEAAGPQGGSTNVLTGCVQGHSQPWTLNLHQTRRWGGKVNQKIKDDEGYGIRCI